MWENNFIYLHEQRKSKETVQIRNTGKEHVSNLIQDLTNTNWEDILESNTTLKASSKLFDKLHESYNTHIPFKDLKAKKINNPKQVRDLMNLAQKHFNRSSLQSANP